VGEGASGDKTLAADKEAEDLILGALRKVEGVGILSEEAGRLGPDRAETLAVVDPLDGSSNFERGIPFYCTSVGVVRGRSVDGMVVGVVRDLVTGDVYHAVRGRGARKNGRPIRTSRVSNLSSAVVGVDLSRGPSSVTSRLAPLISRAKRQVHFGANALELCLLADGSIDSFVDVRGMMRITDFAGASVIAGEAGAVITTPLGRKLAPEFDLAHRFSFVASANASLQRDILNRARFTAAL